MTVMTKTDLNEAIAATAKVLTALQGTLAGQTGLAGAQTNFLCGQLAANGAVELFGGGYQFWTDLTNCFEAAQKAGATFAAMGAVLAAANALTPVGLPAIAVKNFSVRMALVEQARILAATTFTSRQQIDGFFDQIDASLQAAELVAADNLDNVAYVLLINVHAAVSNDLSSRAFTLPQMVTYSYPTRMPSLWIAQRLYQDASRNDELIAENLPIHPLFMPSTGRALAQ
jgi:prophage DNA circulation protein